MRLSRLSICVLLLLGACHEPAPTLQLRFGYFPYTANLLFFVASDRGYFAAERLEVTAKSFDSGRQALAAALAGEVDVSAAYETPTVIAALSGAPVVALTTLHTARELNGLVIRPHAGTNVADLRGKRVGVARKTSAEVIFSALADAEGLAMKDVQIVDAMSPELVDPLVRGDIDAAFLWAPYLFEAQRRLGPEAVTLMLPGYVEMSLLAGQRERVANHAKEVSAFLAALHRAETYLQEHPEIAVPTLMAHLPKVSEEDARRSVASARFALSVSSSLLTVLRQHATWLERQGTPRAPGVSLGAVPSSAYLEEVVPEAVTLLDRSEQR